MWVWVCVDVHAWGWVKGDMLKGSMWCHTHHPNLFAFLADFYCAFYDLDFPLNFIVAY
jgi:hypothetical protein